MTVRVDKTKDIEAVDRIYSGSDIRDAQESFAKFSADSLEPLMDSPDHLFLLCTKDGEPVGFWSFLMSNHYFEVHTNFKKGFRGATAIAGGIQAIKYIFTQTDCLFLTSVCPATIPQALTYAHALGFHTDFRCDAYKNVSLSMWEWLRRRSTHREFYIIGEKAGSLLTPIKGRSYVKVEDSHLEILGLLIVKLKNSKDCRALELFLNGWLSSAGFSPVCVLLSMDNKVLIQPETGELLEVTIETEDLKCQS